MAQEILKRISEGLAPQTIARLRRGYWRFNEEFNQRVKRNVSRLPSLLALEARLWIGLADGIPPNEIFGSIDDELWFRLMTIGYRRRKKLRRILPGLPPEKLQQRFTGSSGDKTLQEGFGAYRLFKQIVSRYTGGFGSADILDFGCGWGRIIRFFLKDMSPGRLWGADCLEEVIQICRETNPWCNFELIQPRPPTAFPNQSFDLIYSYSVFSHLSEDVHLQWLEEFKRLLRPNGILIATTWPREYILECARLRTQPEVPFFKGGAADSFLDTQRTLGDYDNGAYCYSPVGGGGSLDESFYGETCISKQYASRWWTRYFKLLEFIDDRNLCAQNVIVVQR